MLDSPLTLLLLGLSAAGAIASYTAARRRRHHQPQPAPPPALSHLTNDDLLAALATLQLGDPRTTNTQIAAQQRASRATHPSKSAMRSPPEIRDADNLESASWSNARDVELRRRITLLIIDEIERRGLASSSPT
jgi:hypothetical protein